MECCPGNFLDVIQRFEPDGFNFTSQSVEQWKEKDLNRCILDRDPECHFKIGEIRDFAVVSGQQSTFTYDTKCLG